MSLGLRHLLAAALVGAGLFAFSKRDAVLDAFDWDPNTKPIAIRAFDPAAKFKEEFGEAEITNQIRVAVPEDRRSTKVRGIAGEDVPTAVDFANGTATVRGVVIGPGGGPVSGATVLVERFVGEQSAAKEVTTGPTGAFVIDNVAGGRYRVRAWRAPTLAQFGSQVQFVQEGQAQDFRLEVSTPAGREIDFGWSASGWIVGNQVTIGATITSPYVNERGLVGYGGSAGETVTLSVGDSLTGSASSVTDASGYVAFRVTCSRVGSTYAQITVGGQSRVLGIPACSPVPTTTTTRPPTAPPATPGPTTAQPGTPAPTTAPPPPTTAAAPPAAPAPGGG
jgi:hypothetical protein